MMSLINKWDRVEFKIQKDPQLICRNNNFNNNNNNN